MASEIPAARLERLRDLVDRNGVVSLKQAQVALDVSVMTVRRDFAALEQLGVVRRTRGGVIGAGRIASDVSYSERQASEVEAKAAIGQHAASLVQDGDTIFLSGGTTCLAMARAMRSCRGVTVITNSLDVLAVLVTMPELTVIATGGVTSGSNNDMTGPVAEGVLAGFRAQRAFIGASGVTAEGVFNADLGRASMDRVMAERAGETVVLADHTKIDASALALVRPLRAVRQLVTDARPGKGDRSWLADADVSVLVAGTRKGARTQ